MLLIVLVFKIRSEKILCRYAMKWEEGDFGILDNLALAHYAVPGTQDPASRVGLRILHRTTIEGDATPRKSMRESVSCS